MINGENITLRALEQEDLQFLYRVENDVNIWEYSATQTPYSNYVLKQYLQDSLRDIYDVKQLRLVIEDKEGLPVGFIDLFDFDPRNKRVGVGIVISEEDKKQKGYASEALSLLCEYAFDHLDVHQIYANIGEDNSKSIALFEKTGFQRAGLKKDWVYSQGKFKNEFLYQLIADVY